MFNPEISVSYIQSWLVWQAYVFVCVCVTINNGHCEQESESVVGPFCHISLAGSCRDLSKHLRHWRISVSIMNTSTRHLSIITLISSHMSSIFDINLD